jgi:hypothetical protein
MHSAFRAAKLGVGVADVVARFAVLDYGAAKTSIAGFQVVSASLPDSLFGRGTKRGLSDPVRQSLLGLPVSKG